MSLHVITAAQANAGLADFSSVIDCRSEAEFALDHVPGAVNWPTLNNEERQRIGTMYVQENPFEAKKRGAAIAARNIAAHIERELLHAPKSWQPLLYCWRGGKRSGSLALVLDQIGFRVSLIEGGYKSFRASVLADLPALAQRVHYRVICGPTGSGKTRLLTALTHSGAQVLDLEALACHRSSVLGQIPGQDQPTQKRFDTLIWDALRGFDPARPVFIESESKKVGNLAVPAALIAAMHASPCLDLQLPQSERVALLLEDYDFFVRDSALFCDRLQALTELRSKAVVDGWKALVHAGQTERVVHELLAQHYDPGYSTSIRRNFLHYGEARPLVAYDRHATTFAHLAQGIQSEFDPGAGTHALAAPIIQRP
jgi:tRNA 2-selenouridine synthase